MNNYKEISSSLANAQISIDNASNLYLANELEISGVCFYLIRAWMFLATASIRLTQEEGFLKDQFNNINYDKFASLINESNINLSDNDFDALKFEHLFSISNSLGQISDNVDLEKHFKILCLKIKQIRKIVWHKYGKNSFYFKLKIFFISVLSISIITFLIYLFTRKDPFYTISFYRGTNLSGKEIYKMKSNDIDFDWYSNPIEIVGKNKFSARITTCMFVKKESKVVFNIASDDGARILVSGKNIFDNWILTSKKFKKVVYRASKGWHKVIIEYFQSGGGADLAFKIDENESIRLHTLSDQATDCK